MKKAPAQHEIDFRYGEIRKTADNIMTFRMAVRTVAKRHGLHATFMPKPRSETAGVRHAPSFFTFQKRQEYF